ncbi:DUF1178 family protein [Sandaracinobacteroides saxicola]|uniref:DUF1178 family protein n=1 Tax=Sandaracinobacteroides saxicola TaxID=2759707 RepID=A0A7G5IKD6_9SPHN|nr:DUF1178 family protein [Sandaracinobacteroides saxicola]QMW23828.1 DUF1178 family protein [Sandaracinobacteroides saxicola]
MIVFDLKCGQAHVFEAWFGSSDDYAAQQARGLVSCPICGDARIEKALMAPAVAAKGNRLASCDNAASKARLAELARQQARIEADFTWVGRDFARQARDLHEAPANDAPPAEAVPKPPPPKGIYGEATLSEARALVADGVPIAPLPFRSRRSADA